MSDMDLNSAPAVPSPPPSARFSLREDWPVLAIAAVQLALVLAFRRVMPGIWPADDDVTYFHQAHLLSLGGFPSDPSRAVFYPWLLSLPLRLVGLRFGLVLLLQALVLPGYTLMLHHFARQVLPRRHALLACAIFAAGPGLFFHALTYYREFLAGFFLLLTLALARVMRERPGRLLPAALTGVAAGATVMLRAEFGSLLALWAVVDGVEGLVRRRLAAAVVPWLIAGAMAFATVTPAVLAARAAFSEWIFLSTYTGFTYSWSFCGELPDDDRPFIERDLARAEPVTLKANHVMYFSAPSVSFKRRDAYLMDKTRQCIAERPSQTLTLIVNRALLSWFNLSAVGATRVGKGQAGYFWPRWSLSALAGWEMALQAVVLLLLLPGFIALVRHPNGRPVALVLPWFVVYYSTVFFVSRYRVPELAIISLNAAAGAAWLVEGWGSARRRRAGLIMAGATLALALVVTRPWPPELYGVPAGRTAIGPALDEPHRELFATMLADNYVETRNYEAMRREMPVFLAEHRDTFGPALIARAARSALDGGKVSAADLFAGQALALDPGNLEARRVRDELAAARRTVTLTAWRLTGKSGRAATWVAELPGKSIVDPRWPPEELRLAVGGRNLRLTTEADAGVVGAQPGDFIMKDNLVMIVLGAADPPPGPPNPATLTAYFRP